MLEAEFVDTINKDFPHLRVTLSDTMAPTHHFVVKFYTTMIEEVTRLTHDKVCGITEEQQDYLANCVDYSTSLHEHAVTYNLYKAVKYIFDKNELFKSDFHYSDIMFPYNSPKRSFVFMSTLYDFFTNCAEFDERYNLLDTVPEKTNAIAKLKEELAQIKDKIQHNEELKITIAKEIKDCKDELIDLAERNEEEQRTIREIEGSEEALKEKLSVLDEQERKVQAQYLEVMNERKRLESLIVSDSDQILTEYQKLENRKAECNQRLSELERRVQDASFKDSEFDAIINLYDNLRQVLQEEMVVGSTSYDLKGISNAAGALKKELNVIAKEEEQVRLKIKEKEDVCSVQQGEVTKLEAEAATIKQNGIKMQDDFRGRILEIQQAIAEFDSRAQIEEEEMKELTSRIDELTKSIKEGEYEIKQADLKGRENFQRLESALLSYIDQVVAQLTQKN